MNPRTSSPTAWLLGLTALALAAFILVFYVNLLHAAVSRGSEMRYAQQDSSHAMQRKSAHALADPL